MRWTPGGSSDDVEDRRDETGAGGFRPGGVHVGLGGIVVLFILSLIFKRDFLSLVSTGSVGTGGTTVSQPDPARDQQEKPLVDFVTFVLNDTPSSCCFAIPTIPPAARRSPPPALSTVPRTKRSTSIWASTTN